MPWLLSAGRDTQPLEGNPGVCLSDLNIQVGTVAVPLSEVMEEGPGGWETVKCGDL